MQISSEDKPEESTVELPANEKAELTSAKVLLASAQKEYEYEIDRKKTLETRSGVFIAFSGVLFTIITKTLDLDYFKNVRSEEFYSHAVVFSIFFMLPLLLMLFSVYCFIRVIIVKKYSRLDVSMFTEKLAKLPEMEMSFYLMEKYQEIIQINRPINTKNSNYFLRGTKTIGVAAFLIVSMYLIGSIN
jgi:hypothetical protein